MPIDIVGCGRTDAGVHAKDYVAHFDFEGQIDTDLFEYKLNRIVPEDICIHEIASVATSAHARFDAISRSYQYKLHIRKDPFALHSFHYRYAEEIDIESLNLASSLLYEHNDFFPFCKANSDNKTNICSITRAHWTQDGHSFTFDISADRFLRGMIRLIVGMCLNVSRNRLTIGEVSEALANQTRLKEDWSVPAHGLVLLDIVYPYPIWRN
jgi:tRNA pseudouridine38-40 synthase